MARCVSVLATSFSRVMVATVSLAAWVVVVVGAAPAPELSAAAGPAPAPGEDCVCLRPLSDVIWGFLVTLLACTVAVWGLVKYTVSERERKVFLLFNAVFGPVFGLWVFIYMSIQSASLIWRYNKLCRNLSLPLPSRDCYGRLKMLWSWVSPFPKSQGRLLFQVRIVAYVPRESPLLEEEWLWDAGKNVEDESEAMVIGEVADGKTQNGHYKRKELTHSGTAALLLADLLPKYDQLKFLRGNSGFATIALAIQALGYIYAVVFRVVKDLAVAPLEVVGLILNIILLLEVGAYSFFNPCHRPLVIYMNSQRQKKVLEKMVHAKGLVIQEDRIVLKSNILIGVVWMCLDGVVVYFIVTLGKVSSILVVVPLIIFVVASIVHIIFIVYVTIWYPRVAKFAILLSIVAYIWAFVVTIVYWKSRHFDARAELLNVSQLIPFIG